MLATDRPLMGAQKPALQQRGDSVDARHQFRRRFFLSLEESDAMDVARRFGVQRQVSQPAVGVNDTTWLDCFFDKRHQARGRAVGYAAHSDAADSSPIFFCSNDNQGLRFSLTSAY